MTELVLAILEDFAEWLGTLAGLDAAEQSYFLAAVASALLVILSTAFACTLYGAFCALFKAMFGRLGVKDD